MLAIVKCPMHWIKLLVWAFLGNLTFILFLSTMLHEKAEKRLSMDYLQPLKGEYLRIPSPCPLPAPSHACFGINLLGEGGSFAGGGGRPPPPASIFPLTSVGQSGLIWNQPLGRGIKGVGIAIMSWDRYKLSDSKTDNQGILNALFWANSLLVISITQYTSCVHFIAPNHN